MRCDIDLMIIITSTFDISLQLIPYGLFSSSHHDEINQCLGLDSSAHELANVQNIF